jgi:hypothetical protein
MEAVWWCQRSRDISDLRDAVAAREDADLRRRPAQRRVEEEEVDVVDRDELRRLLQPPRVVRSL